MDNIKRKESQIRTFYVHEETIFNKLVAAISSEKLKASYVSSVKKEDKSLHKFLHLLQTDAEAVINHLNELAGKCAKEPSVESVEPPIKKAKLRQQLGIPGCISISRALLNGTPWPLKTLNQGNRNQRKSRP